jgi:general secretion pathway protein A
LYLDHYGLKNFPFQLTPDHRFFFDSRPHRKAMAYLTYGLSKGEGFIVVTGEVGSGKTTLMNYLLTTLSGQNIVIAKVVNTQVEADDLLRLTAASFAIDHGKMNKGLLLRALEATLTRHASAGRRGLLIVDEAQGLAHGALEELRMLSNLQVGNRSILQICLLGQPEFRNTIVQPELEQLRQRVVASYHLGSMDADDTRSYIQHRLLQAGWRGNPHFSDDAAAAIHQHTQGIPRKINFLCDRLLLYGYLEDHDRFGAREVESVVREMAEETVGVRETAAPVSGSADRARQNERQNGLPDGPLNGTVVSKRELSALMERLNSLKALLSAALLSPAPQAPVPQAPISQAPISQAPAPQAPDQGRPAIPHQEKPGREEVDGAPGSVASLEQRLRQGIPSG